MSCPFDLWPAPLEASTTFHVSVELDWMLRCPDDELDELFVDSGTKRPLSPVEVRALAVCHKAAGLRMMPVCDNHKPDGGCAGHRHYQPETRYRAH